MQVSPHTFQILEITVSINGNVYLLTVFRNAAQFSQFLISSDKIEYRLAKYFHLKG